MRSRNRPMDTVKKEYEHKFREVEAAADRRRDEVEKAIPEIRELNHYLSELGLRILHAAMEGGDIHAAMKKLRAENDQIVSIRSELMKKNGFPPDYDEPHYECKLCHDIGYVNGEMCVCMRRRITEEAMKSSGLSALLQKQSFDNFSLDYYRSAPEDYAQMQRNLENAKQFVQNFGNQNSGFSRHLLLMGGTGLGKTHLSTAIAREIMAQGYDVFYNSAIGMLSDFETVRFGTGIIEGNQENIIRYTQCDLLILDDLGTEVQNAFSNSCIYYILNTRLNLNMPTIVNTNLNGSELRINYSDRIYSRFLGEFLILPFCGKDVRQQKI